LHLSILRKSINAEIEVLQSVVAEIYDTKRRKELAREYENKKKKEAYDGDRE
jgi:hypothetical protein